MFFVQTQEKLTHGLVNFLKNMLKQCSFSNFLKKFFENFLKISYAKIMHFSQFSYEILLKTFEKCPPRKKSWLRPCLADAPACLDRLHKRFLLATPITAKRGILNRRWRQTDNGLDFNEWCWRNFRQSINAIKNSSVGKSLKIFGA